MAAPPFDAKCTFSFEARNPNEYSIVLGSVYKVTDVEPNGEWWGVKEGDGVPRWFPSNYAEIVPQTNVPPPRLPSKPPPSSPSRPLPKTFEDKNSPQHSPLKTRTISAKGSPGPAPKPLPLPPGRRDSSMTVKTQDTAPPPTRFTIPSIPPPQNSAPISLPPSTPPPQNSAPSLPPPSLPPPPTTLPPPPSVPSIPPPNNPPPLSTPPSSPPPPIELPPILTFSASSTEREEIGSPPTPSREWPKEWDNSCSQIVIHVVRGKFTINEQVIAPKAFLLKQTGNNSKLIAKTHKKKSSVPEWNELFRVETSDDANEVIKVRFYNFPTLAKKTQKLKRMVTLNKKDPKAVFSDATKQMKFSPKKDDQNFLGELKIPLSTSKTFKYPNSAYKWYPLNGVAGNGEALLYLQYIPSQISGPTAVKSQTDDIVKLMWDNPDYRTILEKAGLTPKQLTKNPGLARAASRLICTNQISSGNAGPPPPPAPNSPPPPPAPNAPAPPAPPSSQVNNGNNSNNSGPNLANLLLEGKNSLKEVEVSNTPKSESWASDVEKKLRSLRAAMESDSEEEWSDSE